MSLEILADDDQKYTLEGNGVWITIGNLSVWVRKSDEGAVVDIYPYCQEMADPLASTYALFFEGSYFCPQCKPECGAYWTVDDLVIKDGLELVCPDCGSPCEKANMDDVEQT